MTDYKAVLKQLGFTDSHFNSLNFQDSESFGRSFKRCTILEHVPSYSSDRLTTYQYTDHHGEQNAQLECRFEGNRNRIFEP
jgi:hypothetical protein